MTYNKETRTELQNQEITEDIKKEHERELMNEIDDGAMEQWVEEHKTDLQNDFIEDNKEDFENYCKNIWDEKQAELNS